MENIKNYIYHRNIILNTVKFKANAFCRARNTQFVSVSGMCGREREARRDERRKVSEKLRMIWLCVQYTKEHDVTIPPLMLFTSVNFGAHSYFNISFRESEKKIVSYFVLIIIFAAVAFLQFIYSYLHNNNFMCVAYFFLSLVVVVQLLLIHLAASSSLRVLFGSF